MLRSIDGYELFDLNVGEPLGLCDEGKDRSPSACRGMLIVTFRRFTAHSPRALAVLVPPLVVTLLEEGSSSPVGTLQIPTDSLGDAPRGKRWATFRPGDGSGGDAATGTVGARICLDCWVSKASHVSTTTSKKTTTMKVDKTAASGGGGQVKKAAAATSKQALVKAQSTAGSMASQLPPAPESKSHRAKLAKAVSLESNLGRSRRMSRSISSLDQILEQSSMSGRPSYNCDDVFRSPEPDHASDSDSGAGAGPTTTPALSAEVPALARSTLGTGVGSDMTAGRSFSNAAGKKKQQQRQQHRDGPVIQFIHPEEGPAGTVVSVRADAPRRLGVHSHTSLPPHRQLCR